jgi:Family of unknown function (DUF6159)/Protein of unknown function (DUF2510)
MSDFAAGWYPDYTDGRQQRYWDGEQWTQYVHRPVDEGRPRWRRRKQPTFKPSAQLVEATYRMVFADRSMIVLVLAGAVLATLAAAGVFWPLDHWLDPSPGYGLGGLAFALVGAASAGAASFVFQLVTGAVVGAAILRAEGRPVTVREALRMAWARKRQLLAWAAVSTVVGAITRVLERFGIGGVLAALSLNIGWAVATVFATPVIMVEGTMPLATIRRSASLLRGRFSVLLVSGVTAALPWMVLMIAAIPVSLVAAGFLIFGSGLAAVLGGVLLGLCILAVACGIAVATSVTAYLEANLYRYAVGKPVPGVDQHLLPPLLPG